MSDPIREGDRVRHVLPEDGTEGVVIGLDYDSGGDGPDLVVEMDGGTVTRINAHFMELAR